MAALPEDAPATIIESFLADHRRLEDSLTRVLVALEAVDTERGASEWASFVRELTTHLDAEDTYLIPALYAARPRDAQSLLHEHRHIRRRVQELGNTSTKGYLRPEVARGFADELAAHARRETATLYEWAEDALDEADREEVLRALGNLESPPAHKRK
jgi:hypothetical protein